MRKEYTFRSRAELTRALAADLGQRLNAGLNARPRASLVLSGGSTPVPLFRSLAQFPLDWGRVDLTLADERWVGPEHPDSNEGLLRRELLQQLAAEAHFIALKTAASTPLEAESECAARLDAMSRPFDAVVLGMGSDGHTASLFPDTQSLARGLDPDGDSVCVASSPAHAPHPRLSLSLAALLNARRIVLHITGEDKWQVYQQALAGDDRHAMPVRAILHQTQVPVDVYWAP